jgi:hypothetical protein
MTATAAKLLNVAFRVHSCLRLNSLLQCCLAPVLLHRLLLRLHQMPGLHLQPYLRSLMLFCFKCVRMSNDVQQCWPNLRWVLLTSAVVVVASDLSWRQSPHKQSHIYVNVRAASCKELGAAEVSITRVSSWTCRVIE